VPAELVPGLRRGGALIVQQDLGEVVAEARPRFGVRAGYRAWRADRDGGRLGQLGDGGVLSVADDLPLPMT
jgi:hypothetical protein